MATHNPPTFSRKRRWTITLNMLVSVIAMLSLTVMVNYLAARHFWRVPVSMKGRTELSQLTRKVLSGITNEVRVTAYFDREDPLYASVWGLLKEYQHANSRIVLEAVDFVRDPSAAQLVKARYQLTSAADKNLVIFHMSGRPHRIVPGNELSDLDISPIMSGQSQEAKRTQFKGEMLFTSALHGVLNPRPIKTYFLQGHGEHRPDSDNQQSGFSKFAAVLRENNVTVEMLTDLYGREDVPPDCQLLIVAGARDTLLPEELEKIDRYLQQGGRAMVLFSVLSVKRQLGLERLLGNWGVRVGQNIVIDPKNGDGAGNMVVNHIAPHAIMKPLFSSSGLFMTLPRSISSAGGGNPRDGLQVEVLATSGPEGRIMTDIRDGVPTPRPEDITGSVSLLVAVEKGGLRGVSAERGATRIVVAGDTMFLSNESIDRLANREFGGLAVNWLLARNELLAGLGPRPIKEYRLTMTQSDLRRLSYTLLLGLPAGVLGLGGLVWFRRQKW